MSHLISLVKVCAAVVVLLTGMTGQLYAGAWDLPAGEGAIKIISTEGKLTTAPGIIRRKVGGVVVPGGIAGPALQLKSGEYLALDAPKLINPAAGSVVFWIRPHWDKNDSASHTFLSLPWQDGKYGYLALSRGWWEPKGAGLTYFIGNNEEHANLARAIRYAKAEWSQLACVWKGGDSGFIRLYVNGILAAENKRFTGAYQPGKELLLGSDRGTPLANNRSADADFAELAFFRRTLDETEIRALYDRQNPLHREPVLDATGTHQEMRAIFDEGVGWQTEEGARRIISRIHRAGFNVYIPCVWHGQGARYPAANIATEGNRRFGARDPLARLISIAHEQGIQVHPWFTVALRQRDLLREFAPRGTPPDAYDLHRPGFRRFIVNLINEVVDKYSIDGINIDFIRTMGVCLCEKCTREYHEKYDRDLVSDASLYDANGFLKVSSLQTWQDEAVEEIVRGVSLNVRKVRPRALISVAGHPTPYASPEGRDEIRWVNLGLVDYIFDMAYGEFPDVETPNLVRPRLNDPNRLVMLIDNYTEREKRLVSKDPALMMRVISYIRNRWGNGVGVYLYSMLSDEQVEAFANGIFKTKAVPAVLDSH